MTHIPITRTVFETIKASARNEVYDAIFRHSSVLTSDQELDGWFHPDPPTSLGVEIIEDGYVRPPFEE